MKTLFTFLASIALSLAHMELKHPAPLRSKYNKHATIVDYSMTSPLNDSGFDFPCKGYLSDLGTPSGNSTGTFLAGYLASFVLSGSAKHGGGSCQASLSTDEGKTFKVIQSYIGNCPDVTTDSGYYPFTIPGDTPLGPAVFAWTWFNKVGNRDMYMNCASIIIESSEDYSVTTAFTSRPEIFVANVGNGCSTVESFDVEFPDPGPDIIKYNTKTKPPIGSCARIINSTQTRNLNTTASQGSTTSQTHSNYAVASKSSSVKASPDGKCGGLFTCAGCEFGHCCSKFGYCGVTSDYCGEGCNPSFGACSNSVVGLTPSRILASSVATSGSSHCVTAKNATSTMSVVATTTLTTTVIHTRTAEVLYIIETPTL